MYAVGLLLHPPLLAVSVFPCRAVPVMLGAVSTDGGAGNTGPTVALVAEAWPASFVAVTVTLKDCPTSAAASVSVLPVWPSDHLYEYVIGVSPDQVPGLAASWSPCCATPEIAGKTLFDGGVAAQATPAAGHQIMAVVRTAKDATRRASPLRRSHHRLNSSTRHRPPAIALYQCAREWRHHPPVAVARSIYRATSFAPWTTSHWSGGSASGIAASTVS